MFTEDVKQQYNIQRNNKKFVLVNITLFLEKGRGAFIRAGACSRIITVCDLSVLLDGC